MSPKAPSGASPSLFPQEIESPASPRAASSQPLQWITANVDGGARGNPGPAGYGVYIRDAESTPIKLLSEYLGHRTNNVAEYSALLAALEYAVAHGHRALKVVSDSELMVKQMT